MALFWGVVPLWVAFHENLDDLLEAGIQDAVRQHVINPDIRDDMVVLLGYGTTSGNSLKVVHI